MHGHSPQTAAPSEESLRTEYHLRNGTPDRASGRTPITCRRWRGRCTRASRCRRIRAALLAAAQIDQRAGGTRLGSLMSPDAAPFSVTLSADPFARFVDRTGAAPCAQPSTPIPIRKADVVSTMQCLLSIHCGHRIGSAFYTKQTLSGRPRYRGSYIHLLDGAACSQMFCAPFRHQLRAQLAPLVMDTRDHGPHRQPYVDEHRFSEL